MTHLPRSTYHSPLPSSIITELLPPVALPISLADAAAAAANKGRPQQRALLRCAEGEALPRRLIRRYEQVRHLYSLLEREKMCTMCIDIYTHDKACAAAEVCESGWLRARGRWGAAVQRDTLMQRVRVIGSITHWVPPFECRVHRNALISHRNCCTRCTRVAGASVWVYRWSGPWSLYGIIYMSVGSFFLLNAFAARLRMSWDSVADFARRVGRVIVTGWADRIEFNFYSCRFIVAELWSRWRAVDTL